MDEARLDRARRTSVAQTAGVIGIVLLLVGALMFVLTSRQESRALDAGLTEVLAAAEDVDDPPPGQFLARQRPGAAAVEVTRSASPELVRILDGAVGRPPGRYETETSFLILAARAGRKIVPASISTIYTDEAEQVSSFDPFLDTYLVFKVVAKSILFGK